MVGIPHRCVILAGILVLISATADKSRARAERDEHSIQSRQAYNPNYYDRNNVPSSQNGRFNQSYGGNYPYNSGTGDGGGQYIVKPMGPGPVVNPYPPGGVSLNGTQLPPIGGPIPLGGGENGAIAVAVQLKGYSNQQLRLDQTRTCSCPQGSQRCLDISPQRMGYRCFFSFMIIISSADSSVQYQATPFVALNQQGQVESSEAGDFQKTFHFLLSNQPMAIDIFVHHLGAVIDTRTGELEQPNTVYHVDTFVQPLNGTTGTPSSTMQQSTLTGQLLGTQLAVAYTVSCRGNLLGPGCDLQCNTSSAQPSNALCQSKKTGYFSLCRWTPDKSQVSDCQNCPWGISENAYCRDESGGVLEAHHAGVVPADYKTATIILSILCGLLLLLLIVSCLYCCLRARRNTRSASTSAPGYNSGTSYHSGYRTHAGEAENRPLQSTAPNAAGTPQPPQRNRPPPLDAKPGKSSLRAPAYQLPPPAHLGGLTSLNDTLNSSFSGSQAAPNISVSADV